MKKDMVKLITFRLADDLFALSVSGVERVVRYRAPSTVPDMSPWVVGVLEEQDRVVPIIDLRRRLSLEPVAAHADHRIIMALTTSGPIGVVVDAVVEVLTVASTDIEPPPPIMRGLLRQFLRGFVRPAAGRALVIILDADSVLSSTDRIALERGVPEVAGRG